MRTEVWSIGLVLISTVFGALGGLLLKLGANSVSLSLKGILTNTKLFLGLVMFGLSSLFFVLALRGGELSVLYPMGSLSYVWITLLSGYFLRERIGGPKMLGIGLIIVGVLFVGLGN